MSVLRSFDNNEKEENEELISNRDITNEENNLDFPENKEELSTEAELLRLEKRLKELHEKEAKTQSCKERFTETVIENLYSKITFLKEEVSHLRNYSNIKSTITNMTIENSSESGQSVPTEADVDSNQSINQSVAITPTPLDSYFNPINHNEHNTIFISQQMSEIPNTDCNSSMQLDKEFPSLYNNPLHIPGPLGDSNNAEEGDTIFIPHDLSHDQISEHDEMLLPPSLPLNEIHVSEKSNLLISDESLAYSDMTLQRNEFQLLNDSWQTSIVAMILMCVLVMVSCFLPLFLIPRNEK